VRKKFILRARPAVVAAEATKTPANLIKLPIVRSKRPGKMRLDNPRIYDIIGFP
jgi:hypothetical protein